MLHNYEKNFPPYLFPLAETAIRATIKAGREILKIYQGDSFIIREKADHTPLTEADRNAHQAIIRELSQTNLPVLSEEGKTIPYENRSSWEKYWLVDPLDGTKEFIKRNGEFTVNIALMIQNRPLFGVIFVPVTHTIYFGGPETGSWKSHIRLSSAEDAVAEQIVALEGPKPPSGNFPLTIVTSRSHKSAETESFTDHLKTLYTDMRLISAGSSLKICLVAEGKAHLYPRLAPTMEWDTAAGHAIAEGANLEILNRVTNQPLAYNKPDLMNEHFIVKPKGAAYDS